MLMRGNSATPVEKALAETKSFTDGSAMLIRGKSLTCRMLAKIHAVSDRQG
jgi:hypothetical protein